ncbi:dephospho-CoA kinase [Leptothoe sp. PORK10 BA2]|uniref:dephospho-CoA kinase n=1 Tax=Leptothoe sp. PORK10 BA2 TaxID=3110254 RepID=UPI003FA399E9
MTQRIIGLTGGIATGKTTVSDYLATTHQLPILDADVYARAAVAAGSPILATLSQRYGSTILLPDGTLNRPQLGTIIFNDPTEKQWVEQQIHPFVRQQFTQVSHNYPPSQTLVYAIPLLFEANLTHLVSEIWVVSCRPEQQQQRLLARNHLSPAEAQARILNQLPLTEKIAQAHQVLDNSSDKPALYQQIDKALLKLEQ